MLLAAKNNHITADMRGISLKSELFGRAACLWKGISDEGMASEGGVAAIASTIRKRDTLSVISEVY